MSDEPAPAFGGFSLPELADHVSNAARYEAFGLECLEVMDGRMRVAQVSRSAKGLAVASSLLVALIGQEGALATMLRAAEAESRG